MTAYFLAVALALPTWASDAQVRPKRAKAVQVAGSDAPQELVLLPPRETSSITLEGPGVVELSVFGLTVKKGRRRLGPGSIEVRLDDAALTEATFAGALPWRVKGRRRWSVSEPVIVPLELVEGANRIVFKPGQDAKAGFLISVRPVGPSAALAAAPTLSPTDAGVAPPPPIAPDPPSEPEPELVSRVEADPVEGVEPGFEILPPRPRTDTVRALGGDGFFMQIEPAAAVQIEARGTGVLVLDFHAHRDPSIPETLDPTVLAVLLDDVLVDTLRVDADVSERYSMAGATFALSDRVQFQVTIPPGRHDVQITLADSALAGGSLRARFEPTDVETVDGSAMPLPQPPPMVEIREQPEPNTLEDPEVWVGFALAGGGAVGNSSGQLGATGLLDFFVLPDDFGRILGLGVTTGVTWVQTSEDVGDTTGTTDVTFTELSVPVLLDVRLAWAFDDFTVFVGAGGGGLVTWAETEALGSTSSTGTEWVWAATTHCSVLGRLGAGWWMIRGQWTLSDPMNIANLRDFDPGTVTATVGYVFANF